jgi:hypothetical protein
MTCWQSVESTLLISVLSAQGKEAGLVCVGGGAKYGQENQESHGWQGKLSMHRGQQRAGGRKGGKAVAKAAQAGGKLDKEGGGGVGLGVLVPESFLIEAVKGEVQRCGSRGEVREAWS